MHGIQNQVVAGDGFAAQLAALFDRWAREHGAPLSNRELTQRLVAAGEQVSEPYMSQLRRGLRRNPAPSLVAALVTFFGVHEDYFEVGASPMAPGDRAVVARLLTSGVQRLLRTTAGLSAESMDLLVSVADELRATDARQSS